VVQCSWHLLWFVDRLQDPGAFVEQGMEIECLVPKPSGDLVV
jgi:ribosomal protein S1